MSAWTYSNKHGKNWKEEVENESATPRYESAPTTKTWFGMQGETASNFKKLIDLIPDDQLEAVFEQLAKMIQASGSAENFIARLADPEDARLSEAVRSLAAKVGTENAVLAIENAVKKLKSGDSSHGQSDSQQPFSSCDAQTRKDGLCSSTGEMDDNVKGQIEKVLKRDAAIKHECGMIKEE